jgi:hypothetical protein
MKKSCLVVLALVLVSGSLLAQGKVLLRYKPAKGQSYTQSIENINEINAMGMTIPQEMSSTAKVTILSIAANGDIEQESAVEKFRMKTMGMTGMIDYDSEDPAKQNVPQELKAIKGKKTKVKMNNRAKVLSTDDPAMEQMMASISTEYPEQAIGVGDTWTQRATVALPVGGEMETITTYKVKARDKGLMEIALNSVIKIEGKDAGTAEGFMKVEEATGLPVEMQSKQDINMSAMGQETKLKGTVKMKVVK